MRFKPSVLLSRLIEEDPVLPVAFKRWFQRRFGITLRVRSARVDFTTGTIEWLN